MANIPSRIPKPVSLARESGRKHNIIVELILFVVVAFVAIFLSSCIHYALTGIINDHLIPITQSIDLQNIYSYSTLAWIFVSIAYVGVCQKRSVASMGLAPKFKILRFVQGILLGLLLLAPIVCGAYFISGGNIVFEGSLSIPVLCVSAGALFVSTLAEEVLIHGYFMTSLSRGYSMTTSVIFSTIVMAILCFFSNRMDPMMAINLTLFIFFIALVFWRTENLITGTGISFTISFVLSLLLGTEFVNYDTLKSVFRLTLGDSTLQGVDPVLLFGKNSIFGGLLTTAVLAVFILIEILRIRHKYNKPLTIEDLAKTAESAKVSAEDEIPATVQE